MQSDRYTTDLYFECHITIDPLSDAQLALLQPWMDKFKFRSSKLLLRNSNGSAGEEFKDDFFLTTRGTDYDDINTRMCSMLDAIQLCRIKQRRFKIENTLLDVKVTKIV